MKTAKFKELKRSNQFPRIMATFAVGIIGVLLLNLGHAATPTASLEVETGTLTDGAKIVIDGAASSGNAVRFGQAKPLFGTLQTTTGHLNAEADAGVKVALLSLGWDGYEPQENTYNSTYIQSVKTQLQAFRNAGMQVVLDLGVQYPPGWLLSKPNSRYVNQYGDSYADTGNPGKNIANMVFNQAMRTAYQNYIQHVFSDLGTDFYYVRAGGGWYSELNYPAGNYGSHTNEYWGYDPIATGQIAGLPAGMTPNPVPSWTPGTASANHSSANQFVEWYMNSLKNYHDWQITTIRANYSGRIAMLYPSTGGLRPGQLAAAVNVDLNGSTSGEGANGVSQGDDYARYVAGITDSKVIVYATWLDANYLGVDDTSTNQAAWSPIHFLAYQAQQNPLHLAVSGENTGGNSYAQMQLVFNRVKQYNLIGAMWAFEPDLFSGNSNYASIDQYKALIAAQ